MSIISKLMAFFMSIIYFFGSLGLGANDPVMIHVADKNDEPVQNVIVYYAEHDRSHEVISVIPIGTTDENGDVQWDNQKYGELTLIVHNPEYDGDIVYTDGHSFSVTVSRKKNEVINLQLDFVYGQ